jgi:hypothetical protein
MPVNCETTSLSPGDSPDDADSIRAKSVEARAEREPDTSARLEERRRDTGEGEQQAGAGRRMLLVHLDFISSTRPPDVHARTLADLHVGDNHLGAASDCAITMTAHTLSYESHAKEEQHHCSRVDHAMDERFHADGPVLLDIE